MVTMNYTGSEKSKLLVIGKSAKPRGFPQNMKHFPVNYESNKTAWMTADIWSKYLMTWDGQWLIWKRKRKLYELNVFLFLCPLGLATTTVTIYYRKVKFRGR